MIESNCYHNTLYFLGSIIHEDNIDLSTHSIIRQTLLEQLLVPPSTTSRYNGAVAITDARKNYISLKGKVSSSTHTTGTMEFLTGTVDLQLHNENL